MSKSLLVVDDSSTMRLMLQGAFEGEDLNITLAEDGLDALNKAKAGLVPDLVLTDVNMPNMDGITLTRELKQLPEYKDVPIIIVTTESDPAKKTEGKEAGAMGWIVKPFDDAKLKAVVLKFLSR